MKTSKKVLHLVNAVLWLIPGVIITAKGIAAYFRVFSFPDSLLLLAGTLVTLAFFLFIFSKVTAKYISRVRELPRERNCPLMAMSLKGYVLFAFMIALGMVLKAFNGIPDGFYALFYSGLGPALLYASLSFFRA
ncbi:MAG: hypothetical protein ACI4AE_01360 [Candidatus Cryptobacteroides sp.]